MADTLKRLSGPTVLTTSAVTQYTVPADTTTTVRDISVCNEGAALATFTLSLGTDGAGTRLYYQFPLDASSTLLITRQLVLNAGDIIQALSDTATSITLVMSGVETS